jgi:hypothetical protein
MPQYIDDCAAVLEDHDGNQKVKRDRQKSNKLENKAKARNLSMDDLRRMQEELFARARAKSSDLSSQGSAAAPSSSALAPTVAGAGAGP